MIVRNRQALLVLGMHRSGSSLLAGMLHSCGVDLGKELLPPLPENPKGFYENKKIYELNEEILDRLHTNWNDIEINPYLKPHKQSELDLIERIKKLINSEFRNSELFCLKDPRLSLLYPLYLKAFEQLSIQVHLIECQRDHLEIAMSLKKRNGFNLSYGYALSMHYSQRIKTLKRNHKVLPIPFNETIADPKGILKRISNFISSDLKYDEKEIRKFVRPDLHRNKVKKTANSLLLNIQGITKYYRIRVKKWILFVWSSLFTKNHQLM